MTKRERKTIRQAGPYKIESCADGTLKVTPEWPEYSTWKVMDEGGPGLGGRLELAAVIEKLLNEQEER